MISPAVNQLTSLINKKTSAAIIADTGMVKIQAQTMRSVTPHLTAESLFTAPTPDIAPVMTWVVLTGMPRWVDKKMLEAAALSAQKPSIGFSLVIFCPIVFTIRQPPVSVPIAMAAWALKTTHKGT